MRHPRPQPLLWSPPASAVAAMSQRHPSASPQIDRSVLKVGFRSENAAGAAADLSGDASSFLFSPMRREATRGVLGPPWTTKAPEGARRPVRWHPDESYRYLGTELRTGWANGEGQTEMRKRCVADCKRVIWLSLIHI